MSPVFRHGRLRLYLLKLLDEEPRHGYEVIRLLQDRFLGVYAPSPGTIYPRLARLEEEGLVTHDEVDGKKVYRLTDKGRAELHARYDDLAELEEEITASVRDIALEVSEDVRATVRSLREELTSAARGMRGSGRPGREDVWGQASSVRDQAREAARAQREQARAQREQARAQRGAPSGPEAEAEPGPGQPGGEPGQGERGGPGPGERGGPGWGWGQRDWGDWGDWSEWAGWARRRGQAGRSWGDPHAYRDMERIARQFARELHRAAGQAQVIGEEAVASLRDILEDTLDRIRTEVFAGPDRPSAGGTGAGGDRPSAGGTGAGEGRPSAGGTGAGEDRPSAGGEPGEPGNSPPGQPH